MALERIGLGGVFTFDGSRGVRGLKAVQATARDTSRVFKSLGTAVGSMGQALGGIGLAATPLTAALGGGIALAANFEQQMSAVGAITQANSEDMARLELKAKQMGATTVFSATQSAQAMEFLGRAGFSTNEIIDGLGGVMNAAAADGMDLASAANIVSNVIKGMGLTAKDTTRVADVLALTSAKTNTDISLLGSGFTFAAAQAKTMGIDLETTSAALGVISDAGIKGTRAGTSFTNMLVKLSKPSSKATALMRKFGVQLAKNKDGSLNLIETTRRFNDALKLIPDRTERAAAATEIFSVRGQKAFNAMGAAMDNIIPETGKSKLETLTEQLMNASGAAEEMAKRRLDNLKGQLTLLASAMEGFALETAGQFLEPMTEGTANFVKNLGNVVQVLQLINQGMLDDEAATKKFGATTVAVAKGIASGIQTVIAMFKAARQAVTSFIQRLTGDTDAASTETIAKFITIGAVILGAIAPILIGIGALTFFVTTVLIPAFTALGSVFAAVGGLLTGSLILPLIIGAGLVWVAWKYGSDQIISALGSVVAYGQTAWSILSDGFQLMWTNFMEVAEPSIEFLRESVLGFVVASIGWFRELVDGFTQAMEFMRPLAEVVFAAIGFVGGHAFQVIAVALGGVIKFGHAVFEVFKNIAKFIIEDIVNAIADFVRMITRLADAVNIGVPAGLREFAAQGTFRITGGGDNPAQLARDATDSRVELAKATTDQAAAQKQKAANPPPLDVHATVENKQTLDIKSCLQVDGREMAVATGRHKQEVHERAGFKAKRWQQRFALEQGAEPIPAGGG